MKHYQLPNKQRGMSKWGWLFTIVIFVVVVNVTLKLVPHYMSWQGVLGAMDKLPEDQVHDMTRGQIREHFTKQFRVENFTLPVKEVLSIERDKNATDVTVGYEIREHVGYNASIVLEFSETRKYRNQ